MTHLPGKSKTNKQKNQATETASENLKKGKKLQAGDLAQYYNAQLACTKPWTQSPPLHQKTNKNLQILYICSQKGNINKESIMTMLHQ